MKKKRIKDPKALKAIRELKCVLCGWKADACHIRSKGAGGDDVEDNLISLCRDHHTQQHSQGWSVFIMKNPSMRELLAKKGWRLGLDGKLRTRGESLV